MDLSNRDTSKLVQKTLDAAKGATVTDRVKAAWRSVNVYRLSNCGYGLHWVAAEHYLYMRHVVGMCGGPFIAWSVWYLATLYDLYKAVSKKLGFQPYSESDCPPSDPSPEVLRWAQTGIVDGVLDFLGLSSMPPTAPPRPYQEGTPPPDRHDDAPRAARAQAGRTA